MLQKIAVSEGAMRVGPLIAVPRMLRELGADPAEIVTDVGLDLSLFDDPENTIPFAITGRLLKWCAVRTRCPHFGLLIGQQGGISSLGLVGFLAQHSPNVGTALRNLILHLHLHDRGAIPVLSVEQGVAVLSYLIYQQGVEGSNQICDGAIAITFNILRALCGPAWFPTEVLFSHRQPDHPGPYRRFFRAPLRFDMEQTALVFPVRWLNHPVADVDPRLRRIIEQKIAEIEKLDSSDLVSQLRRILRILLMTRQSSLAQIASLFSLHRRTVNRRLQAQGTTFQALVDEVRYEIARQLLENTHMSISQIAATLDYSDASAFTRAYRRWSGMAPVMWRARL